MSTSHGAGWRSLEASDTAGVSNPFSSITVSLLQTQSGEEEKEEEDPPLGWISESEWIHKSVVVPVRVDPVPVVDPGDLLGSGSSGGLHKNKKLLAYFT